MCSAASSLNIGVFTCASISPKSFNEFLLSHAINIEIENSAYIFVILGPTVPSEKQVPWQISTPRKPNDLKLQYHQDAYKT